MGREISVFPPGARPTVLVVDDEEPNRQLLAALLSAQGFEVRTARDGPSALAETAAGGIDLVLLDVMMPSMDGLEVCRRIREEQKLSGLIIVFVTALSDRESRQRAKEVGANDFLVKPVDSFELRFRAQQWLKLGRLHEVSLAARRYSTALAHGAEAVLHVSAQLKLLLAAAESGAAPDQAVLARALTQAVEHLDQIGQEGRVLASKGPGA